MTILFCLVLAWAVASTIALFWRNPLPWPDRGHRVFAVKNGVAVKAVLDVLSFFGLKERFTFDAGPTHQSLLWDNTTTICSFDEDVRNSGIPLNGLSVPVSNPPAAARDAAFILRGMGFTATIHENVIPDDGDKFVIVESDAFSGWIMAFRRHILAMGLPPNKRRLTD